METAIALALRSALAARGERITYRRGTQGAAVAALRGRALSQAESGGVVRAEWHDGDWLILAADLAPFAPPRRGDEIVTASGETWEVLPPASSAHYTATQETLYRVHAKRVA